MVQNRFQNVKKSKKKSFKKSEGVKKCRNIFTQLKNTRKRLKTAKRVRTKPKKIYKKSNIKIKKRVSDLEILCK